MKIKTSVDGTKAIIEIEGKLTVNTSPDLTAAVEQLPDDVCDIDVDFTKVDYIASAGLRVLVATDKLAVKRGGRMRILHPCSEVRDVLEMTGLSEVFTIER
ncbi:MAG: STAS domain-containing protein [Coriobacteriales bacterium]|nr:STAS domain-containing protein [Coriobacteriales bacterium]